MLKLIFFNLSLLLSKIFKRWRKRSIWNNVYSANAEAEKTLKVFADNNAISSGIFLFFFVSTLLLLLFTQYYHINKCHLLHMLSQKVKMQNKQQWEFKRTKINSDNVSCNNWNQQQINYCEAKGKQKMHHFSRLTTLLIINKKSSKNLFSQLPIRFSWLCLELLSRSAKQKTVYSDNQVDRNYNLTFINHCQDFIWG